MIGIYKITNRINGKAYVGLSTCIERRWKSHKADAFNPNDKHYHYPLYRAMRKYGLQNFHFEVLEECLESELSEKEIHYIALFDSFNHGYNQDAGGQGAIHYNKLSDSLVLDIIQRLKTSSDNSEIIGAEFGVSGRTIRSINAGEQCPIDGETYPIRGSIVKQAKHAYERKRNPNYMPPSNKQCVFCGRALNSTTTRTKYCVPCAHLAQRRVERPSKLDLAKMIHESSFTAVGQYFGVDGNAIKKWCKQYEIPYHKQELSEWYLAQTQTNCSENT